MSEKRRTIDNDVTVRFGSTVVSPHGYVPLATVQSAPLPVLQWPMEPSETYTIIMIDHDAPYPQQPTESPFLHWMQANISEHNPVGDTVIPYMAPSPPRDSDAHRYEIFVFAQPSVPLSAHGPHQRSAFAVQRFARRHRLIPVGSVQFSTGGIASAPSSSPALPRPLQPVAPQMLPISQPVARYLPSFPTITPAPVVAPQQLAAPAMRRGGKSTRTATGGTSTGQGTRNPPKTQTVPGGKIPYMLPGAVISESDARTCRCTLHVGARQPSWCLAEKAYFQKRTDPQSGQVETCYNPYAVCVKSTGRAYPGICGENFNYDEIPDEELRAFAYLHSGVAVPKPWTRDAQLHEIAGYVCSKSPHHPICSRLQQTTPHSQTVDTHNDQEQ